jgi:hypothetical protein
VRPPIDQRTWRDSYTDPDAAIPGGHRRSADLRQQGERRAAPDRRAAAAEHRPEQRWHAAEFRRPKHASVEPVSERPGLTVIPGDGRPWAGDGLTGHPGPQRTGHLRAVAGERYGGPAHRA